MARLPYPDDAAPEFVESQRPDSLPEQYGHIDQQPARNVYRSVAHEPELVEMLRAYLGATWEHSGLDARPRELLLLAVAHEINSAYEWHQHVRVAILEGLTPEEIRAISAGDLKQFDGAERALVEFGQAAAGEKVIDNDIDRLRDRFTVPEVAGITSLAGAYVGLNVVLSALDVETEEPFVGWDLEKLDHD